MPSGRPVAAPTLTVEWDEPTSVVVDSGTCTYLRVTDFADLISTGNYAEDGYYYVTRKTVPPSSVQEVPSVVCLDEIGCFMLNGYIDWMYATTLASSDFDIDGDPGSGGTYPWYQVNPTLPVMKEVFIPEIGQRGLMMANSTAGISALLESSFVDDIWGTRYSCAIFVDQVVPPLDEAYPEDANVTFYLPGGSHRLVILPERNGRLERRGETDHLGIPSSDWIVVKAGRLPVGNTWIFHTINPWNSWDENRRLLTSPYVDNYAIVIRSATHDHRDDWYVWAKYAISQPSSTMMLQSKGGVFRFAWAPYKFFSEGDIWAPWQKLGEGVPTHRPVCKIGLSNPEIVNDVTNGSYIQIYGPEDGDISGLYERGGLGGDIPYEYRWQVAMQSDIATNRCSPYLWWVKSTQAPDIQAIAPVAPVAFAQSDVLSISGRESVIDGGSSEVNIEFQNRGGAWKAFDGVHGIKASIGREGQSSYRRFTGFIMNPTFSRPDDANSSVILKCVDKSIRLRDTLCVNYPIYDGYCSLYAIYDLCKRAGLTDDEILLSQDPRTGLKVRFIDVTDWDAKCVGGMCEHYILPYGVWRQDPLLMPQMGTPVWEVILEIAVKEGAWPFFNNYGNFVYITPATTVEASGTVPHRLDQDPYGQLRRTLKEIADDDDYNQFWRLDSLNNPSDQVRNAALVTGLDVESFYALDGTVLPRPIFVVRKANLMDTTQPNWIPWYRWFISTNLDETTLDQVQATAEFLYYVSNRPRWAPSVLIWGEQSLFWLDRVDLVEFAGETYLSNPIAATPVLDGKSFRVIGVNWDVGIQERHFSMTLDLEWLDPTNPDAWFSRNQL